MYRIKCLHWGGIKGYTQSRESFCSGSDGSASTVPYRGA